MKQTADFTDKRGCLDKLPIVAPASSHPRHRGQLLQTAIVADWAVSSSDPHTMCHACVPQQRKLHLKTSRNPSRPVLRKHCHANLPLAPHALVPLGTTCFDPRVMAADNQSASVLPNLNTLTDQEKADGWKLLFDGKTTDGWRNFKKKTISAGWRVIDGALCRLDKTAGDIISDGQYDNFILELDYKVPHGANSGVMHACSEDQGKICVYRHRVPNPRQHRRPRRLAEVRLGLRALQAGRGPADGQAAGRHQARRPVEPRQDRLRRPARRALDERREVLRVRDRQRRLQPPRGGEQVRQDAAFRQEQAWATSVCKATTETSASGTSRSSPCPRNSPVAACCRHGRKKVATRRRGKAESHAKAPSRKGTNKSCSRLCALRLLREDPLY